MSTAVGGPVNALEDTSKTNDKYDEAATVTDSIHLNPLHNPHPQPIPTTSLQQT